MKDRTRFITGTALPALLLALCPLSLHAQQLTPWMFNVGDGATTLPKGVLTRKGADRLPVVFDFDKMPPEKPAKDQPQWQLAPLDNKGKINYGSSSSSIIPKSNYNKFTMVDYTYFRAYLDLRSVPKDSVKTVEIVIGNVDDQARAKIYNSMHLAGTYVEGSDGKRGGKNFKIDFSEYVVVGEVNTFTIVQVDDNPGGNLLTGGITVFLNGAVLEPDPKPLPPKVEGYAEPKFNLVGNAKQVEGQPQEYSLTTDEVIKDGDKFVGGGGAVWTTSELDLSRNFTLKAEIYLGKNDTNGADGLALVIQNTSNSTMGTGEGLGYDTIAPSYAVEFDTFQNPHLNDPAADHVGARGNGSAKHEPNDFKEVVNLEDGKWHPIEFTWNAAAKTFNLTLDSEMVFEGKSFPKADGLTKGYFGFTATTGGYANQQSVRNMILVDES
ncbi:MAG: hypothetical protein KDN22_00795 [Verrucomicrobiae bacterium]|nr:hypothetical protein [Verrucomicrobiae bacterium]